MTETAVEFDDVLSERYLAYALSTIVSRSLPDVRDGLKPVHRRLLHAMHQLRLRPGDAPKKCARVVGDVIGKFHPHGDSAVYDALVRLAQDFAVRYPLVDGQGNFGNIDGDNAAAMRYTEARLTSTALLLLEGIEEDAVDFRPTYDGTEAEPVVLPAAFPNLLCNGAQGIAVGMATSIPPHNAGEVCAALIALLDDPGADPCAHIRGPDFPTGGVLCEHAGALAAAYAAGRGSFRLRARWTVERLAQGQYQIVVTEIPYQVAKAKLVERLDALLASKKLPLLADARDESAEDIRLVLTPRSRNVDPALLMESLFRTCDLEVRFPLNMNALDGGRVPRVMPLRDVLFAFLAHRREVLQRCSAHRLAKVRTRLEVLDGYLIVYLNIDQVIAIIRSSDYPKPDLMAAFGLSDVQAEAVLNMRLRALRKLEEIEIRAERDTLTEEQTALERLLASEAVQWQEVRGQIGAVAKAYAGAGDTRRTAISGPPVEVAGSLDAALTEREAVTVVLSEKGWIRAMKGHGLDAGAFKYKEGDGRGFVVEAWTTDKLLAFADAGRVYTIACDKLPSGRGFGEPLRLAVDLSGEAGIVALLPYCAEVRVLLASREGRGFVAAMDDLMASTRSGKQALTGCALALALPLDSSHDHLAVIGQNRKLLAFPLGDLPVMARGKGVLLQRYKDGGLADARAFAMGEGLTFKYGTGARTLSGPDLAPWLGKRASAGRLAPTGFPRNGRFG
ncbi:MAG TPA: DNA topoisomerase IV subunit A [Rhodospirillaceae bacterium]|jgi:topoisomerase-4 subunit A|nr:DNA topoisomerase IV subunit A [Alphaproteobacteria bacterium]HBH26230.1 DNA topoisomerase IV subunit A [Rhodospirillaceae bacterium]